MTKYIRRHLTLLLRWCSAGFVYITALTWSIDATCIMRDSVAEFSSCKTGAANQMSSTTATT